MLPPPLPAAFSVSAKEVRWPWMFSSAVRGQSVTVSCATADWFVKSHPWWLEVQREGNQLLLTPKNCGFHSGKVRIQQGKKTVSMATSAWILPNFWGVLRGIGAGSAAGLVPLAGAVVLLMLALVLGFFMLFSLGPYGINPFAALVPMAAVGLLMLGPIPIIMGSVWGAFLRSWRAWLQSMSGTLLGAVLTLLAFHFVHGKFGSNPPSMSAAFKEISALALVWVGSVAMCTAGWRMILPSIPVVLAATALMFTFAGEPARDALTNLDQPFKEADAWSKVPVNKESTAEVFRMFSPIPGMFRSFGWLVNVSIYVQLVFVIALPLLMMFVVPIPKRVPPRQPVRKVARMDWQRTPRVVPHAWRKLRL
jgi:hypothetical protein